MVFSSSLDWVFMGSGVVVGYRVVEVVVVFNKPLVLALLLFGFRVLGFKG